jgi:hypothetical protein
VSTIIQRTNPNPTPKKGHPYACCICHTPVDSFEAGVKCAKADVRRRKANRGKPPVKPITLGAEVAKAAKARKAAAKKEAAK